MQIQDYLSVLNPEQLEAVKHNGSPLLILAGAGSGKTRVITTKIAWLIAECGISPYEILAVTFTNKAAREMRDRVTAMEPRAAHAELRTFHAFGAWFLRRYHEEAALNNNFTIYDDDDAVTLLSGLAPELLRAQVKKVLHGISRAKDYGYGPDDPHLEEIDETIDIRKYYSLYQNRLNEIGNLDFGDLILKPVQLLRGDERVKNDIHRRFKVILVDEYQDSNVAQFLLLQELAGPDTYLCVVGDDDQSIYKFRGAEVKNILSFPTVFENTYTIKLERNYRSIAPILAIASDVVEHNEDRLGKTLKAERNGGKKPVLIFLQDQDLEADFVTELIMSSHKSGTPYSDWAILYRTNAQSLTFESKLLHYKIPYQVIGSLKFYEREEIKDALAYLAFIVNPRDEVAFKRIVNKPSRGIGEVTQKKIIASALQPDCNGSLLKAAENMSGSSAKKTAAGLKTFVSIIKELSHAIKEPHITTTSGTAALVRRLAHIGTDELFGISAEPELPDTDETAGTDTSPGAAEPSDCIGLAVFVRRLIELTGLDEYHKAQDEIAGTQRIANLQELVNNASLYELSSDGLTQFLEHIDLDRSALLAAEDEEGDAVTLITVHNTKGLEFNRVIMTGLELGVFPREDKTGEELEEERRLMYVGITRARNELYLTSCAIRRMYGKTTGMLPSPFLSEIQPEKLDILGTVPRSFSRSIKNAASGSVSENTAEHSCGYQKGDAVYNDDYGYGYVTSVETHGDSGETVVFVQFENSGTKQFLPARQKNALLKIQSDGGEY